MGWAGNVEGMTENKFIECCLEDSKEIGFLGDGILDVKIILKWMLEK
jgi:hypothetical protein